MGGRINEQLQETSGAGALTSRKKIRRTLKLWGGGGEGVVSTTPCTSEGYDLRFI